MVVGVNQIQTGVINFIENEIAKKAVGLQKFATYFFTIAYADKVTTLITGLQDNPMIKPLGIFNENGNVDLDKLYNFAKGAIQKSGQFTVAGIIFNETDVDKLYEYIKRANT